MNEVAATFLKTYEQGLEVEGGWMFGKALQQAKLDFTDDGLHRLDQLFAAIRDRVKPSIEELHDSIEGRNFCSLIVFHLVEVVRRRTGANMDWCDQTTARQMLPKSEKLPDKPFARLVAIFQDQGVILMPLTWVEDSIFGDGKDLSASEYVATLIGHVERNGPAVWWSGMYALGRIASWQMMMTAEGESVQPLMLRSTAPLTWVALMGADKENSADVLARAGRGLDDNPENSVWQVLAYDGFVELNSGRVDAIIVMLRTYNQNPVRLKIAFPYTPTKFLRRFKILDPTLRESNIPDDGVEMLGSTMQRGIQSVKWAFGKTWDKLRV